MEGDSSGAPRASISVSAAGTEVGGEIRRAGSRYVVRMDDAAVGDPTGLDVAIFRLATELRAQLPPVAPPHWEVRARCHTAAFTLELSDEGPPVMDAEDADCIRRVLSDHPSNTLSEAIETAARAVTACCR